MTNDSPIFPFHQSHNHFSDYGFDPQLDYFQVLEEARKHKSERSRSSAVDSLRFKLQKPISKDDSGKKIKKNRKRWWWKNALLFFKRKRSTPSSSLSAKAEYGQSYSNDRRHCVYGGGGMSGPVYITESRSGSATPYHYATTTNRPSSGPLAGTLTPTRKGDVGIPYFSLRELNMDQQHRSSATAMPIYLVT